MRPRFVAHRIMQPSKSVSISSTSRSTKTRSPTAGAYRRGPIIQPAETSPALMRRFSSAISGFRSLCGRERHSQRLRSNDPAFWNLLSAGSRLRPLVSTRLPAGPATLDRCCGRNVVVPGGYSKRFFCVPIGLYRGILRAPTARKMPARSALGGLWGVNPAVVIRAWISPA